MTNIVYWYILILLITALNERRDMIRNSLCIYRKRAGMTQFEVAKKLDTKQFIVSLWESGQQIPTVAQIEKMAIIFDTTVSNLYDQKFLAALIEMKM